ncbi:hypothetical protein D9758_004198 [Tetrapyrgos nigripes]|uniref:Uncharacterized protein n=1 Tax=Tetrapyrgos nigripes TaxID=182062 RepID=A0A8H5LV76_9AGAR|nr:hypothetical protein D9758_004198 [Tetrapyrgos nigripes]
MPLFSPLLRLFMVFLNMYDTYKTLKEPPSKYRRTAEGEYYGPSPRAVVQRKRDLKGCLAVWIVWCCFTLYERILEPIVYLFIPFYDEFKAIVLLFLILTRARVSRCRTYLPSSNPTFPSSHIKTIDSVLELARMIGDMLFALVYVPYDLLKPWVQAYVPWSGEGLPPNGAVYEEYRRQEFMKTDGQNGRVQSYVDETRIYEMRASQQTVIPQEFFRSEHSRPLSEPTLHQQQLPPYLHPDATMSMPNPTHFSNLAQPGPSTPGEIEADLEWRRYAPLPSAYPPTPHIGSSTLAPKHPVSMGFDAVAEDYEDGQQDFDRSLLPPREPLNPGYGKRGLSDKEDGGNISNKDSDDRDAGDLEIDDSGRGDDDGEDGDEMDTHTDESDDSDDDYVGDDDEDDFNVTLRTPRAPLPLNPQAGSTIRTRASARSIVADMEKSRQTFLVAPALVTPSVSGQSTSSRLTTNDDGSSLGTRTADLEGDLGLLSDTESLSASPSASVSDVSDPDSEERPNHFLLGRLESTHNADSDLVPDSPESPTTRLPSLGHGRQTVQDDSEDANNTALGQDRASTSGLDGHPLEQLSSTSQESSSSLSDGDDIDESDASGLNSTAVASEKVEAGMRDESIKPPNPTKLRALAVTSAAGKRRKIATNAPATGSTRALRPSRVSTPTRGGSTKSSLSNTAQRKPAAPSTRSGVKASLRKSRIDTSAPIETTASRSTRSSSRLRSAASDRREDSESSLGEGESSSSSRGARRPVGKKL